MRLDVKAGCFAAGVHLAMYAWWIWSDALLSDDYYMFATAPNFDLQASAMFRPLGAMAADALTWWLQASPGAVYWAKGLSVALSASFAGVLGACFARATGSTSAGLAMALLISTNPGNQINAVWLCTLPIWITYVAAAAAFYCLIISRDWRAASRRGLTALLAVVVATMLLAYQMAPFVLAGAAAAYIVLARDDRQSVARVIVPVGVIIVASMCAYLLALWYVSASGIIESGRASGALGGIPNRLASIQPEQGLFWFNQFVTAPQSAIVVSLFIAIGAALDTWLGGVERALRWSAAALLTIMVLCAPGALNDFQAARLYAPGAIGVAGLITASAIAIMSVLPPVLHTSARATAVLVGLSLGIASQTATANGVGQTQHAELQHIRNQIAKRDLASLTRVHLIPPPDSSTFWTQPIRGPANDMYVVRLSTYHPWTREGIVRFALRYFDPTRKIAVTVGPEAPTESDSVAVVDMRPANRALFQIPY